MEDILNPTRRQALSALSQRSIVHFACHGESMNDPSESRLLLEDWKEAPLTVADISSLNIDFAKFAFLSACQSGNDFTSVMSSSLKDLSLRYLVKK